jgi:hypothetical protein
MPGTFRAYLFMCRQAGAPVVAGHDARTFRPADPDASVHTAILHAEWTRFRHEKNEPRTLPAVDGVIGYIGDKWPPVRLNNLLVNRVFPA